jgi:hypothetical protein
MSQEEDGASRRRRPPPEALLQTNKDPHPFQVLAAAVLYDAERPAAETWLTVPLEQGRLHENHKDNNPQFAQALAFLQQQQQQGQNTPPPTTRSLFGWVRAREGDPDYALTPIILSGLLMTAGRAGEPRVLPNHTSSSPVDDAASFSLSVSSTAVSYDDTRSELVWRAHSLRQAALAEIHAWADLRRYTYIGLPVLVCIAYILVIAERLQSLQALNLGGTYCESTLTEVYYPACRLADAHVWMTFRDSAPLLEKECVGHATLCGRGPLAWQARFRRTRVALTDMFEMGGDDDLSLPSVLSPDDFVVGGHSVDAGSQAVVDLLPPSHGNTTTPWEWLSASMAHHAMWADPIFRDALSTMGKNVSMLDAGCGVAASLWSLLPAQPGSEFSYHGITLSQAEVSLARTILRRHNMSSSDHDNNETINHQILVEQRSYDDPALPRAHYNLIVALESLAFSPNLDTTIGNLVETLQPGGLLVIADEFSLPGAAPFVDSQLRRTPSLSALWYYTSLLETKGCAVQSVRDYALEFQYEGYHRPHPTGTDQSDTIWRQWSDALFSPWLPGAARYLSQLQSDQRDLYRIFRDKREDEREGRTTYALLLCQKTGQAL